MSARLAASLAIAFCVSGCSLYGDAQVYGAFYRVSVDDLRAATALIRRAHGPEKIYAYRIISRDEIRLYTQPDADGSYYGVRRVDGHWQEGESAIVLKERIGN